MTVTGDQGLPPVWTRTEVAGRELLFAGKLVIVPPLVENTAG